MSLLAEALATNQEKSLSRWLDTHLVGTEGLTVFYASSVIATRPDQWVNIDYLLGMRRQFGRQIGRRAIGGTSFGSRVHGFLNLNLCQQRVSLTSLYALAHMRDAVLPYLCISQKIPILDFATVGTPEVGRFVVEDVTEQDTDGGYESGIMVKTLSIAVHYIERHGLV